MRRPASRTTILPTGNRVPLSLVLLGLALVALIVFPFLSMLTSLPSAEHGALLSHETLDALWTTLVAAGVAILADAALGIPLAYWMARSRSPLRHVAVVASLLPLAVPPVVGGLELVLWLGPYGWLGKWLLRVGLNPLDTIKGTILAQMFIAAPFVIVSARAAFASVEPAVTDAARSLGCGPWRTLLRVTVPAARRGIAAGLVLGWLRAVGEFGASIIVAFHPYTLANLAYVQLSGRGLRTALPTGAVLAAFGVVAALGLVALDADRPRRRGEAATFGEARAAAGLVPATTLAEGVPVLDLHVAGRVGTFDLDSALVAGERTVALLGSSGAGKSLTVRTVAGLLRPGEGRVELCGQVLLDTAAGVSVPAERRRLGYVSQGDSLFRHLDVEGNVAFAVRGVPRQERAERVERLLAAFGLSELRHARPVTLSGGERQQVALARALAAQPVALLLDEPFSNLDAGLRRTLRGVLREIHDASGIPIVLVTHDRDDALDLADYVVVMDGGRVLQQGPIEEVFAHPVNRLVAQLVGIPNVVAVQDLVPAGRGVTARTAWGDIDLPHAPDPAAGSWELAVPADAGHLVLSVNGAAPPDPAGEVVSVRPGPAEWRVVLQRPGGEGTLTVAVPRSGGFRPPVGSAWSLAVDGSRCTLMAGPSPAVPVVADLAALPT